MLAQTKKLGIMAIIAVVAAASMLPVGACAKESGDDTVVAMINGDKILKKDVMNAFKILQVKQADEQKAFPLVVDQIINEKLISDETVKQKIEQSPEFVQQMAAARAQLLKTIYIEKYLKDKVTDKAVKTEYEKLKKENKGKEEVHAHHILVATEAEAKQVIKDLDHGAKFADLAKERSKAQNGGDIGYFTKGEVLPEISDAAFALKPGTYTEEPIKTQFGWHVVYVDDRRQRQVPDLKDLEANIRAKMGQDAVNKLVMDLRAKADIKRFGLDGKPLQEPVKN